MIFLSTFIYSGGASKTGDYSEQQLVDCGYGFDNGYNDNHGCKGAEIHGYLQWLVVKKQHLASEADYPYTSDTTHAHGKCRSSKKFNQGLV